MNNRFLFIICLSILVSWFCACTQQPAQSMKDYYEEKQAIKDSLRIVDHKRINDSLLINDKGRIVDSIYLGMSQNEYNKYIKILRDKVDDQIEIAGINFDFDNSSMDFGSDNKLHVFGLKTEFDVSARINLADQSKNQVNDPGEEYVQNLVKFFSKKYGEPDSIINDRRETCHILDADHILWIYSTRVIEICPKLGEISIKFFDPNYYKEQREKEELLKSLYRKAKDESHDKRQKYGDQL